jgi:hypothetical protein
MVSISHLSPLCLICYGFSEAVRNLVEISCFPPNLVNFFNFVLKLTEVRISENSVNLSRLAWFWHRTYHHFVEFVTDFLKLLEISSKCAIFFIIPFNFVGIFLRTEQGQNLGTFCELVINGMFLTFSLSRLCWNCDGFSESIGNCKQLYGFDIAPITTLFNVLRIFWNYRKLVRIWCFRLNLVNFFNFVLKLKEVRISENSVNLSVLACFWHRT